MLHRDAYAVIELFLKPLCSELDGRIDLSRTYIPRRNYNGYRFLKIINLAKRLKPDLYERIMNATGCRNDKCLSLLIRNVVRKHLSLESISTLGDICHAIRERSGEHRG